jgi:hypothetical protein
LNFNSLPKFVYVPACVANQYAFPVPVGVSAGHRNPKKVLLEHLTQSVIPFRRWILAGRT